MGKSDQCVVKAEGFSGIFFLPNIATLFVCLETADEMPLIGGLNVRSRLRVVF